MLDAEKDRKLHKILTKMIALFRGKCLNFYQRDHSVENCGFRCWRCLAYVDNFGTGGKVHQQLCKQLPLRRDNYDGVYITLDLKTNVNDIDSFDAGTYDGSLKDTVVMFKNRLQRQRVSIEGDTAFLDVPQTSRSSSSPLILPFGTGVYNGKQSFYF